MWGGSIRDVLSSNKKNIPRSPHHMEYRYKPTESRFLMWGGSVCDLLSPIRSTYLEVLLRGVPPLRHPAQQHLPLRRRLVPGALYASLLKGLEHVCVGKTYTVEVLHTVSLPKAYSIQSLHSTRVCRRLVGLGSGRGGVK